MTINDDWEEFNRWVEQQGHDEPPSWLTAVREFLGYVDDKEVWVEL